MFDAPRKALPLALSIALASCAHAPSPAAGRADAAPRAALRAFLSAERAGDFEKVYAMLAGPLRARYTPARLQADLERDRALAEDKLARIQAALDAGVPMKLAGDRAALPLGANSAAKLVEEDGVWRVASLE